MKKINSVDTEKYSEICNETFNWCLYNFGSTDKKVIPKLKISYDKRVKNSYGSYLNGVITIYPNVCKKTKLLIKTILHEYRHFLQMPNDNDIEIYNILSKKFKYIEHPFEIDSIAFEKKYYKFCKRHLKNKKII